MENEKWIILDTETTGFKAPVFAVELAAQRMCGWERDGEPFRRLLNHNCTIPPDAARVHGYTPEILERDGDPPLEVYQGFREYAGDLPVVAYNLAYDWDKVLLPEWDRLGIAEIGTKGFCAYLLAQRFLDPVPAGNCKLQTLRQYYRLPERGAHTALGDVDTVIDLMQKILRPIAEDRGLVEFERIRRFTMEDWFPSRIPFGKFKGRAFYEANDDADLRSWLDWLAKSENQRSSRMGAWYLEQLEEKTFQAPKAFVVDTDTEAPREAGLIIFQDPEVALYQKLIETSRARLADLELEYGVEKAKVDSIRSRLFQSLRGLYQEKDRLRLLIEYRESYIATLLSEGEESAEETASGYEQASSEKDEEYESTAAALEGKRELEDAEKSLLKKLWLKLVRAFHPDQYEHDPEKRKTYEQLTQVINGARECNDIELLKEIANNPEAYIMKKGWSEISLEDGVDLRELRSLFDHLQMRILEMIEVLDRLRSSPDYELFLFAEEDSRVIDEVVEKEKVVLEPEIETLRETADKLKREIEELTGTVPF